MNGWYLRIAAGWSRRKPDITFAAVIALHEGGSSFGLCKENGALLVLDAGIVSACQALNSRRKRLEDKSDGWVLAAA
jgi:hypothetical protein